MRPEPDQITWIAAFDGGKAVVFKNAGFDDAVDLQLVERFDNDNPPDRDQTADRPGRHQDAGSGAKGANAPQGLAHGRSGVEQTDRHALEKVRFIDRLVARLAADAEQQAFDRLVLLADQRSLGEAREQLTDRLERRIIAEEAKDVVNEPADKLEARVQTLLQDMPHPPAKSHLGLSGPEDGRTASSG